LAQNRVLHSILQSLEAPSDEHRNDARLVSVTNPPLAPMVLGGHFKRELHDRIAVLTLGVPPLRERHGDIALLAADSCAPRRRICASPRER